MYDGWLSEELMKVEVRVRGLASASALNEGHLRVVLFFLPLLNHNTETFRNTFISPHQHPPVALPPTQTGPVHSQPLLPTTLPHR